MIGLDIMSYDETYARFRWDIPNQLNMAQQVCDDWAARDPDRIAVIDASDVTQLRRYSYADLRRHADTLAHHLVSLG